MKTARISRLSVLGIVAAFFAAMLGACPTRAEGITLPPEAVKAMDKIYGGDPDAAIVIAHEVEKAQPDHPLGYPARRRSDLVETILRRVRNQIWNGRRLEAQQGI